MHGTGINIIVSLQYKISWGGEGGIVRRLSVPCKWADMTRRNYVQHFCNIKLQKLVVQLRGFQIMTLR